MRVAIHGELMEDCINNRNFAQYTSASANDTLSEIAVKTNSDSDSDHLVEEMCEWQSISCHFADVLKIRRNPHLLRFTNSTTHQQCQIALILLCHYCQHILPTCNKTKS